MDPRRVPVSSIMQTEFVSVSSRDRLDLADHIMRLGRVRHLPVVDEGRLVGVLSNRDLLAASLTRVLAFEPSHRGAFLRAIDVEEIMTRDVATASPDTPLAEAARRMVERKIGCLPVVREHRVVVGIVTETDLLRAAYLEPQEERAREARAPVAAEEAR